MAGKKVYAVRRGRIKGIFWSWEDCKESVDGFPGAEYKGFSALPEALQYMEKTGKKKDTKAVFLKKQTGEHEKTVSTETQKINKSIVQKNINVQKKRKADLTEDVAAIIPDSPDKLLAYVDGSYNHSLKKYAFGCVFILPDGSVYTESGNGDNPASLALRNVTGEMLGSMFAVRFAMINDFKEIEIRYDYEGIEKWVTGVWKSKTELTRKYAASMRNWGNNIRIIFQKVTAHTNVYYNEMADQLAKDALVSGNGVPHVRRREEMEPWQKDHIKEE